MKNFSSFAPFERFIQENPILINLINFKEKGMRIETFQEFLKPLSQRPALAAFFCSVLFLSTAEFPLYGIVFVPVLITALGYFSPFSRRVSLCILIFFGIRFLFTGENIPGETSKQANLPAQDFGFVESVLERPEGVTVIVQSSGGKVRLSKKEPPFPLPGDSIFFTAKWYPVTPPTIPGGFDTPKWLKSQNLKGFGKLESFRIFGHRPIPEEIFSLIRKKLKSYFAKFLSPAETGLLIGLLAGDRSSIPDSLQSGFRRAGIVHVLAISGFHVVLLSGMVLLLLKATRMPHKLARIIAILMMLLYAPIAGGSPAVYRAVFMFTVVQLGNLFQRKADSLNSLGVALLILTVIHPDILWNVGFQLSASATAGIIAYGKRSPTIFKNETITKNPVWKFFENHVLSAIWITLVATASTAPFLVWSFHSLSPISIVGNIFVVPLVSLGMQAGIFALLVPIFPIASIFCNAAGFLFRLSAFLVNKISAISMASVTVGPFPAWVLLLFGVLILSIGAFSKNRFAKWLVLLILLSFGAFYFWTGVGIKTHPSWKVVVLDIGQGDCIFVQSPRGNAYLVDVGVNSGKRNVANDKIIPFLQENGIWRLKGIIVTHPDLDHFSGANVLMQEFPVENLYVQECSRITEKPEWTQVLQTASKRNIPIQDLRRGMLFRETTHQGLNKSNSWEMRILHPDPYHCGETNSESITIRVSGIGGSMLLTGDLTKEGEKEILATDIPLQTDILKLGHHGSKTSSSREFLEAVAPKFAIASNGRHNKFHHPHPQVVERLDSLKIPLWNTSQKGTVQVEFDENGYRIKSAL